MSWVLGLDEVPRTPAVGLAICVSDEARFQLHVGLLCSDGERTTLLELRWHHLMCNDPLPRPEDHYVWAKLNLPPPRINAVLGHALRVFERHPQIKYGLVYDGEAFVEQPDGLLKLSGQPVGLTCATFVLAVLQTAGLDLVGRATWPVRAFEDERWRQGIIAMLTMHALTGQYGVTMDHVRNVANEPIAARFRPEEVTGACADAVDGEPVAFQVALERGRVLLSGFVGAAVVQAATGLG